jgi:hypothetical protein
MVSRFSQNLMLELAWHTAARGYCAAPDEALTIRE